MLRATGAEHCIRLIGRQPAVTADRKYLRPNSSTNIGISHDVETSLATLFQNVEEAIEVQMPSILYAKYVSSAQGRYGLTHSDTMTHIPCSSDPSEVKVSRPQNINIRVS